MSTGAMFVLIVLSGVWLSHSGKSLTAIILEIHKLISLATLVFLGMSIYQMHQVVKLSTREVTAVAGIGVCFLSAIVSGGLLSTGKPMPTAILTVHQLASMLAVLSTVATLYRVFIRKS